MAKADYSELKGMLAKERGASEAEVAKAQMSKGFVNMKRTKSEIKERNKPSTASIDSDSYPYGLQLRFENESLKKLGIDDDNLPEVGEEVTLTVKARVDSVSSRQNTRGDDSCCVEMQVTAVKMGA